MESIKELMLNIKGHLYERINSPFLYTFVIIIVYYYWPVILYIFDSKLDSISKIKLIQEFSTNIDLKYEPFIDMVFLAILLMVIYSILFTIGVFVREFQFYISKKIKKWLDVDFVNSKKYAEVISKLERQVAELYEKNHNKDLEINSYITVVNLTPEEIELFNYVRSINSIDENELSEYQRELCRKLHIKQIFMKTNNSYSLSSNFSKLNNNHL
ncbi:MAG: hypothetical protein RBR65_00845 [Aliarcobacter sp.]|nr:hypothetical protein [Aliarcobacter sp.]